MAGQNTTELVIDGSGALRVLGGVEKAAEKAGAAVDGLNASGKQTGQAFSTGAVDRFTQSMAKMEEATRRGAAITTESVSRRTAEQKALERWQSRESEQMALQIRLRREAERAAVDMANAVRLGYTSQEAALQSLVNLERQHASQIQGIADVQQNATKAATSAATANNTLAGSLNRVAAANDNARFASANVAAQFQDVAVTAAMGMNPMMIALQQGTQLSAVLTTMQSPLRGLATAFVSIINPVSLLTIGFVALSAAAVQYFMSAGEDARKTDDILSDHADAIRALKDAYGEAAKGAKEYLAVTQDVARAGVILSGDEKTRRFQSDVDAFVASGEFLRTETQKLEDDIARIGARINSLTIGEMNAGVGGQLYKQLDDLYRQLAAAGTEALVATEKFAPFRAELEAFAKTVADGKPDVLELQEALSRRVVDPASTQSVRDLAAEILGAIEKMAKLQSAGAAGAAALSQVEKSATATLSSMRALGSEIAAFGKIAPVALSDVARAAQILDDVLSRAISMGQVQAAVVEYEKAMGRLRGNALADLDAKAKEVAYGGLSERKQATLRIVDEYEAIIKGLREVGASEKDVARATDLMNTEIARSVAHFDELERKAGEKGAAKAIKEVNREMESFISRADGLLEKAFPGEAARREAEELLRLLDLYGSKLDSIQRAAVESRIADQFTAASLGVRELDRDATAAASDMGSMFSEVGNILAGIFSKPINSLWDFVDQVVQAIGQIGQKLMSLYEFDWGKVFGGGKADPVVGIAGAVSSAVRSVPASYIDSSSPAAGARAASELQTYQRTLTAVESGIRYVNQGATRNQQLSARLTSALEPALQKFGLVAEVFSGGQPSTGSNRVGSHRHDLGNAADLFLSQGGVRLNWAKADQREIISQFVTEVVGRGVNGIGAGPGYMREGSLHVGFGGAAVWGASGKGSNAPDWLRQAYNAGLNDSVRAGAIGVAATGAALPQTAPVPTASPGMSVAGPSGTAGTGNKVLAGLGAAASGFAAGYQSQDPITGALSGALGGIGAGPIGIIGGLIGGLIGGFIGLQKAVAEARAQLKKLGPEIETFISVGMGYGASSMKGASDDFTKQAKEYAQIALKARDNATVDRLREAAYQYEVQLKTDFATMFEGNAAGLRAGLGLDNDFSAAQAATMDLREALKGFVADAQWTFGLLSEQDIKAREAASDMLLATIDVIHPVSEMVGRLQELAGNASIVQQALVDLGVSSDQAAGLIRERLIRSIDEVRRELSYDIGASVLELGGEGHLTQMLEAQRRYYDRVRDLNAAGLDAAGAQDELVLSLAKLANGADMTRDEFTEFAKAMGVSESVLTRAASLVNQVTPALSNFFMDLSVRMLELSVDTSTLAGQLALFDRRARIEIDRMKIEKRTAEELTAVERALGFERQNLINQFYRRDIDATKSTLDQVFEGIIGFVRRLRDTRVNLALNNSLSPLSPLDQLNIAQNEFYSLAQAAMAGDRNAMEKVEGAATTFLEHARDYYASTEAYARIFQTVYQTLQEVEQSAVDDLVYAAQQLAALQGTVAGLERINGQIVELRSGVASADSSIVALSSFVATDGSIVTLTGTVATGLDGVDARILRFGDTLGGAIGTVTEGVGAVSSDLWELIGGVNLVDRTIAAMAMGVYNGLGTIDGTVAGSLADLGAAIGVNLSAIIDRAGLLNTFVARDGTILALRDAVGGDLSEVNSSTITIRDAVENLKAAIDVYLGNGGTFDGIAAGAREAADDIIIMSSYYSNLMLQQAETSNSYLDAIMWYTRQTVLVSADVRRAIEEGARSSESVAKELLALASTVATSQINATPPQPEQMPSLWDRIMNTSGSSQSLWDRIFNWAPGFADGGWTGNVGVNSIAGVTHGQEFVVPAPYAAQYRPVLEGLSSGRGLMVAGNDNSAVVAELRNSTRVLSEGFSALVTENRALKAEVAELREEQERTRKAAEFTRKAG